MARAIWNMLESPMLKKVLGISLPKVEINKKIFIPKLDHSELFIQENMRRQDGLPAFTNEEKARACGIGEFP